MHNNRSTMTRKELPARAANIQRAISSTTTCTPATVESLRSFLLPTELPVLHSKTGSVQDGARNVRAMPRSKATGLKTKKGPVVAVLEVAAEEDQIQKREKIQLATEVVNGVLKGLSEAIKRPPLQKRTAPLRRTSSNISGIGSRSHTPLQPLSVNSVSSTSSQKGHSRRSSSTGLPDERLVGLRAQAECGRIAFATLRLMYGQKGSPKIPAMQLESGMSALIGRMITLGFEDLAMKELRILRRRLEGYSCSSSEQRVVQSTGPQKRREQTEAKVEALADLLHYSDLHAQGQLLALIVTTQLQTIKIITLKKESLLTQSAVRHLALNAPYSPANMIQRQVESESPASRDKAAQQLESLAQSLINLCPSISSAQDRTMSKSTDNVSPDTAFDLQLLALRIRLIWWELAGHCVNLTTEIIQPFYQYLSAFRRRSRTDQITKYMSAKAAFGIIAGKLQNITGTQETSSLAVYHVLADLAQESDQYHEAIDWIRKSRDCGQDHGPSQTRICNLNCRIATLHLRTLDSGINEAIPNALMSAMISLSGNLQGESTELDELLISVVSLRRSAFAIFQKAHTPSNSDPGQDPSSLSFQCSELVLLCLKFVLRYAGSGSSDYENEVKTARRDRRRQLAARVSNPIIESVAVMARFSARTTPTAWAKLDAGLQDCRALAVAIGDIDANDRQVSSENKQAFLSFVSISNAYWCRYLYLNQRPVDSKTSRDCLRTCIDLIRDRPSPEKVAGLMSLKLEKYARACEVMRDYGRAAEVYEEALYAQVQLGLLKNAGEAAEFRSMPDALDSDTELGALTRVLIAYPRTAAKAKAQGRSVRPFLDIETLGACERGVLLEQQLIALLSMYDELERSSTTSSGFQNLAKTLLSIYTRDLYPVRRLRIIVRLMRLTYSTSELLDEDLRELVQQPFCIPGNTHLDMKLVQFLPHLTKCREVLTSLGQNALDVKGLERIMATWSKLPHEFPCWDLLRMQIYDMLDWLSLLESVAEYLDMQGLERTRVSVLHVLVTIHEAASSTQCSTLISKLSALGLQYARLGYSGIAGVVLRKAQRFLDSSEVPVNVALGWQLNYAEHALYIGDLKAW